MCIPKSKDISISIEDLAIGYRTKGVSKVVACNIQAQLGRGEMTCLIGSNGAGKSTLLRTLSAFQPPLKGHIYIKGKDIRSYSIRDLSHTISVVMTERCEAHNLTVTEVVELGRSPYTGFWGTLSQTDNQAVCQAMCKTGIIPLANRMLHTLSDGENQKVMIAKALAQETSIILLDEPTAFLDFSSKVELMSLLRKLAHENGKTIFLSTHDLNLAIEIADKIWIMNDKKEQGVTIGTPEDLILNGSLPHLYEKSNIVFDETAGIFHVKYPFLYSVGLKGEGVYHAMMKKALERNGIRAVKSGTKYYIEALEGIYRLMSNGVPVATSLTVEEMLCRIQSLKPLL